MGVAHGEPSSLNFFHSSIAAMDPITRSTSARIKKTMLLKILA